jgi:dTDP-4-amino-4,6-dideoxygalactose transaminase
MGGEEIKYVTQAFESNWIAPVGPMLGEFESALSKTVDVDHAVVLSSGTAAIQLALIAFDVQPGDEVICSSFTFAGSCNPIIYLGASPVFVDSENETWNMDPELLEVAIKDRVKLTGRLPKAIILVHLYGMPARMDEIMTIASRYGIPVVEDAAEALGSTYKGRKLGSMGTVGVFSFNGNKIITTSGGGALVSKDKTLIDKARFLSTQARDPAPHYEHSVVGYNFRLSNVCAAIGVGQLKVLGERVRQRRANFDFYSSHLGTLPGVSFTTEPDGYFSNRWLTTILLNYPDGQDLSHRIRTHLEAQNIESRPLWKPMHLQPVFRSAKAYVSGVSEKLFNCGLCLPSGSSLATEQLQFISDQISSVLVTSR